jgi:hypothetical protein
MLAQTTGQPMSPDAHQGFSWFFLLIAMRSSISRVCCCLGRTK